MNWATPDNLKFCIRRYPCISSVPAIPIRKRIQENPEFFSSETFPSILGHYCVLLSKNLTFSSLHSIAHHVQLSLTKAGQDSEGFPALLLPFLSPSGCVPAFSHQQSRADSPQSIFSAWFIVSRGVGDKFAETRL